MSPADLQKAAPLLLKLQGLQENLAFTPLMIKKCLTALATERQSQWQFVDDDIGTFSVDMGKRVRTMCRHWIKACRKKRQPAWLVKVLPTTASASSSAMPGDGIGEEEAGGADEAASEADCPGEGEEGEEESPPVIDPVVPDWKSGWDAEHNAAWRHDTTTGFESRELTKDVFEPSEAEEDSPMLARWPDGYVAKLQTMTVRRWREMKAPRRKKGVILLDNGAPSRLPQKMGGGA